ncbi:methyl-accepting chemotaxis protein-1 (serine sensor receptor) [Paraburkholderia atlantica]|uniref:Methyl-accepting chemotaxis protein-1 (Serine sensor receptor) n=1 Tax=Paraburkholderia atlantica TaxID=2654982 RepID=A0A7W8Q5H2_PARAM|nr:methyl-accepting chemotaxis protein [Paraburkholderia atlantica]MBB5424127.1 methyl-accepting chemotaxis protein-1 (serine sensor receptor) [Paraburkholderia atlantica]
MTPNLAADSFHPVDETVTPSAVPRAPSAKAMSLQARLAVTIGLLALLMTVIGALGLAGAWRANRANQDTYENKLTAAMHIGNAELLIGRTRLVLGGAMAQPDGPRSQEQIGHASDFFKQSDDEWRAFVDEPHEPGEAPLIEAASQRRVPMREAMHAFIDALKAGDREGAQRIGTVKLSPLFNAMSEANDALKRTLYANAKRSYDDAEHYFHLFFAVSAAMIAFGIAAAGGSWIALRRAIMSPLNEALAHFEAIAAGDLQRTITNHRADEMGRLLDGLRNMQAQLAQTVTAVRLSSRSIGTATAEIAAGTLDLSSRTEEQAASLEETAASMTELTETVRQNATRAQEAHSIADKAAAAANDSKGAIARVSGTMERIESSARKIADITGIIEGIAFQTNILALNAAVEAARAGTHGRGFAVVAAEVRSLAQHAATAAKEIGELVSDAVLAASDGTTMVAEAEQSIENILDAAQRFANMMGGIVSSAEEQRAGIEQVDAAVNLMDAITQQNAALVEEASAAAQALDQQSRQLEQQVASLRVAQTA